MPESIPGSAAAMLPTLGWSPDAAPVREVLPTAARGHNIVLVSPPAPAYGGPVLAGVLDRLAGGGRGLLLCPSVELEEWAVLARALAAGTALRIEAVHTPARAARRLRADGIDLLVTAPETALALVRRSALKTEALTTVVVAWPDRWQDPETLTPLMQDLPKEAQRVVLASDPGRAADFAERYAWRALVVGAPGYGAPAAPAPELAGPVRTVTVSWNRRAAAVADLLELLDPATMVVWAADRSREPEITRVLPAGDTGVQFVTGDAPPAAVVVAFDVPDAARLRQLLEAGEVVLLVPPGTEPYVERLAAPRRPLRLPGLLEMVAAAAAARRATIARTIEAGRSESAFFTLAPLFDRYEPTAVAAALYQLWVEGGAVGAAAPIPDVPATVRVYVGVGRNDGATANDLVAVLTKELRVAPEKIGRIEVRETYMLVELPAQEAEQIAGALTGTTIRRKRVVARLDRGRPQPGPRAPAGTRRLPATRRPSP